ncbi:ABC transporter substrate-binding protein [Paenibacillus sinopodophylli]|uniref:ABC transporter substrate-binding protein n=1 Tax=Paenibacillus sinopodophylli TaxID=1837342 RepID=UPI00110CD8F1|nr:extracellular solute-binding protein [Paenibacillus sinopodophylli]
MKKGLIFLLAMMIIVVAGCSSAGNNAEGGKTGEASGEVTKLTMWSMETRNKDIIEKSIKQFNDEHPNIQLSAEFFEDEALKTKMKVAITGNQVPDIITYWSGETFETLVSNDMLGDITEPLNKDEAFKNDVLNGGLETFSYDGKNYGIPVLFSGVSLWYNKQIFEENGLTPPTTYAELLTVVDQFNTKNIVPITVAGKDRWPVLHWFSYLAQRIGGMEPFDRAKEGEADFTQDTFVKAGEMLRELAVDHKGFINGFLGLDYAAAESLFTSGKAAMYLQGEWAMNSFLGDDFADKVGFVPFPVVDGGNGGINIYQGGFGAGMAISSKTNQEAAYEAIRFLTDSVQRKEINEGANISPMKTPGLDQSKMNPLSYAYGSSISSSLEGFFSYYDQALDAKRAEQFLNSVGAIVGQKASNVKDELAKIK